MVNTKLIFSAWILTGRLVMHYSWQEGFTLFWQNLARSWTYKNLSSLASKILERFLQIFGILTWPSVVGRRWGRQRGWKGQRGQVRPGREPWGCVWWPWGTTSRPRPPCSPHCWDNPGGLGDPRSKRAKRSASEAQPTKPCQLMFYIHTFVFRESHLNNLNVSTFEQHVKVV